MDKCLILNRTRNKKIYARKFANLISKRHGIFSLAPRHLAAAHQRDIINYQLNINTKKSKKIESIQVTKESVLKQTVIYLN